MAGRLDGKVAVVTGASSGIGEATVRSLAGEGAVVVAGARRKERLDGLVEEVTRNGGKAIAVECDVTDEVQAHGLVDRAVEEFGRVDILVNNAGAIPGGKIEEVDDDRWREAWDLKVFGYVNMMRALYREMRARGRGVIVNVIGTAGDQRPSDYAAGVSANAALATLTRALGGESLDHGVRVVGVSPGDMINERGTEFLRRQAEKEFGDPGRWRERLARLPGGRAATSEEVADIILFLASPRAAYVSGAVLTVDGGMSSRRAVI